MIRNRVFVALNNPYTHPKDVPAARVHAFGSRSMSIEVSVISQRRKELQTFGVATTESAVHVQVGTSLELAKSGVKVWVVCRMLRHTQVNLVVQAVQHALK